ncbi:hypothetical protein AGRO_3667 [Agrobacterium sp. ATCC 31749]|uniref:Uncharacterized protein n=1 Tax=Agrobacterium fabrum TaxID=1176649 RepID=A0A7Z7FNU0_9HYPH|nr:MULTISPECIES: hypothetical protein [Agrobacterium]EGL63598.1 hypothetical protein AGRO_3667 [Agrobacterium sp. ATCC 31749]QKW97090.1 hypothetical protein GSF67_08310 [Agrobacterium sp. CGMCC 11546]SDJ25316.1 hypothetical protein SAMN05428983_0834 [Agrobacterium fabrum]
MIVTSFEQLPFVASDTGRIQPWAPVRTDDYQADCDTGRLYFTQLRSVMTATENPLHLSRVLQAQVEAGKWEGVEIGFAQAMAEALC